MPYANGLPSSGVRSVNGASTVSTYAGYWSIDTPITSSPATDAVAAARATVGGYCTQVVATSSSAAACANSATQTSKPFTVPAIVSVTASIGAVAVRYHSSLEVPF